MNLFIFQVLEQNSYPQRMEKIFKLCGNSSNNLRKISLNDKPYYRSMTNRVLIKWRPRRRNGKGFKAIFTAFKYKNEKGN